MKTVVITGSTRGIGLGMANEFLNRGHQVVISGTSDILPRMFWDLWAGIRNARLEFAA